MSGTNQNIQSLILSQRAAISASLNPIFACQTNNGGEWRKMQYSDLKTSLESPVYTYNPSTQKATIKPYADYANAVSFAGYGFGNRKYSFFDDYTAINANADGSGGQLLQLGSNYTLLGIRSVAAGTPAKTIIAAYQDSVQISSYLRSQNLSRMSFISGEDAAGAEYTQLKVGGKSLLSAGLNYTSLFQNGVNVLHADSTRLWAHNRQLYVGTLNTSAQDVKGAINEIKAAMTAHGW